MKNRIVGMALAALMFSPAALRADEVKKPAAKPTVYEVVVSGMT
jgi:hypothetical protein